MASAQAGLRIFVVRSDERESYERAQRLKAMERVKTQLEALQRRVEQGKPKAADKIGARRLVSWPAITGIDTTTGR